ncbi:MAG: hypothetical protein K2Q18_18385 [Bdellovibrionales bacterium]|nr:hypothetical protein [Bdellovibrionales bacterium]
MITTLPLTMLYSFLLWAVIIFTILGCAQLMLFEISLKRQNPKTASYTKMSPENKKAVHKILFKVGLGLVALISLALLDRVLILT